MKEKNNAFEDLQQLQKRYVGSLADKLSVMKKTWREACHVDEPSDLIYDFYRKAHNLSITAASLGLDEIGDLARQLETSLTPLLKQEINFDATMQAEGQYLLNKLIEVSDEVAHRYGIAASPKLADRAGAATASQEVSSSRPLVYIVDQDVDQREQLYFQIESYAYDVKGFETLVEFEEQMAQQVAKVVIMDISISGDEHLILQSLNKMRERHAGYFSLICISERDNFDLRMMSSRFGADSFFVKPLFAPDIIDALARLVLTHPDEALRVLIIDDNADEAKKIGTILRNASMVVQPFYDPSKILQVLGMFMPDLIVMNHQMSLCSGKELVDVIRQAEGHHGIPIVILYDEKKLSKRFDALGDGADDYMFKPMQDEKLIRMVRLRAERFRAIRHLMMKDSMTGLLNHNTVLEQFERELLIARRRGSALSFAIIQIDHLKEVYVKYGYPSGDTVVKSLSRMLKQHLRKSDIIGRYGEEEFVVVLRDAPLISARKVMENIRMDFEKMHFKVGKHVFQRTLSCGIAADDGDSSTMIVKRATEALADARVGGRNRIVIAS